MARRASFRRAVRAPKRRTFWRNALFQSEDTETLAALANSTPRAVTPVTAAAQGNTAVNEEGITLVRIRGSMSVQTGLLVAERVIIAAGLIVIQLDDQGTFTEAALPGPITNDFAGWFWRGQCVLPGDAGDFVAGDLNQYRFDVDTKAMRKLTLNEGLVFVWQVFAVDAITTETFEWAGSLAQLFME